MKKLALLAAALSIAAFGFAGQTSTLIGRRSAKGDPVTLGKWHPNFSKCKSYAAANGVPLIAVWSNGDACGHCVNFESAVNHSNFTKWMKSSGCVFYFIYPGDGGDGAIGSDVFHWIRNKKNTSYPFVRIYWYENGKKKVDIATVGDNINKAKSGKTGANNAVAYFKAKLKNYNPKKVDPNLPYSIAFEPNYPAGSNIVTNDGALDGTNLVYSQSYTLPDVPYACSNIINGVQYAYSFAGWSKSATGSVSYKNRQAVSKLTSVSNAVVTLYARWTKNAYGPFYTKVKKTINVTDYKGTKINGYTTSSKISGLKWNKKGYWTGTPSKAGVYTVTYKKSSSKLTRKFVILADTISLPDAEGGTTVKTDKTTALDEQLVSVSGSLTGVTVSSLKDASGASVPLADFGLSVSESGEITGRPKKEGTYKLTVKGKAPSGLTLTKTIVFEVTEGDILLLNGLAHADELCVEAGASVSYPISIRLKGDDGEGNVKYAMAPIDSADVTGDGASYDSGMLTFNFQDAGTYEVTVTAHYTDGEEEDLQAEATFKVTVLEAAQPE